MPGKTDKGTEGRKDGQTLFYRTLLATAGDLIINNNYRIAHQKYHVKNNNDQTLN